MQQSFSSFNNNHPQHLNYNSADPGIISFRNTGKDHMKRGLEERAFSMFLVGKGLGSHVIDGQPKEVHEKQLHFVFSGQDSNWALNEDKGLEIDTLHISETVFETFGSYLKYPFSHYMKVGAISLSEESFDKFKYEFINISEELENRQGGLLTAEFRLKVIMLMLSREIYKMHYEKRMDSACLLSRFITLVFENFRKHRDVKFYADELAVTTNYLNILCNKHLDKTATTIINRELLSEIKQYLIASNLSIKELATLMHFGSVSSFHTFFKKNTGLTPKEFQNKYMGTDILNTISEDL